jgi:hypothetical protein
MKTSTLLLALLSTLSALSSASAQAQTPPHTSSSSTAYIGRDGNWFNPSNWSTGRVPGAQDDVVLDAGDTVLIDPAQGTAAVHIRDLLVGRGATLETRPGTLLQLRDETIEAGAQVNYRGSAVSGDTLVVGGSSSGTAGCAGQASIGSQWCGLVLNPTPKSKRIIVLQSSVLLEIGLGGLNPAAMRSSRNGQIAVAAGPGHYATLSANSLSIDGQLWLNLHYGFQPLPGERYTVLRGGRSSQGQFIGLGEGALAACTANGVGLYVSYRGGDGNDVELRAALPTRQDCAHAAVQPLQQWQGQTPQTAAIREHVLLARQVGTAAH